MSATDSARLTPDHHELRAILAAAILAPSADNHHHIRFQTAGQALEVYLTVPAMPAAGGYKRTLELLSVGALLENLAVAAGHHGWSVTLTLFPDPGRPQLLCRVAWAPAGTAEEALWQAIPARQTNRRLVFRGPRMNPQERDLFDRAVAGEPGVELVWLDRARPRRRVLTLMRLAESARFRVPALHRDLFSAVRFDVGWQSGCDVGLPPGALGVERPLRASFALLRHWPVMRLMNLLGAHRLLGYRAAKLPARLSPHVGLIALDKVTDASLISAGRLFERVWLLATHLGYALQPMPAAALYAMAGAVDEGVPVRLQRHLALAWQAILPGRQPIMLFRLGRAQPLPVRTGRPPLEYYWPDAAGG